MRVDFVGLQPSSSTRQFRPNATVFSEKCSSLSFRKAYQLIDRISRWKKTVKTPTTGEKMDIRAQLVNNYKARNQFFQMAWLQLVLIFNGLPFLLVRTRFDLNGSKKVFLNIQTCIFICKELYLSQSIESV